MNRQLKLIRPNPTRLRLPGILLHSMSALITEGKSPGELLKKRSTVKLTNLTKEILLVRLSHGGVAQVDPLLAQNWPEIRPRTKTTRHSVLAEGKVLVRQNLTGILMGFLPPESGEYLYIVSKEVAERFPYREDLLYPSKPSHTSTGYVVYLCWTDEMALPPSLD